MIRTVIFDLDGTLLDTEDFNGWVFQECARKFLGQEPDPSLLRLARMRMFTVPQEQIFQVFCETLGFSTSPNEVKQYYLDLQLSAFRPPNLTPGAERLIRHLHASCVPMGIATNTRRSRIVLKTKELRELFDLIPHTVTIDDVARGKPDPEIMLALAQRMNAETQACLVFEDSPKGITAAKMAGMSCIGLTCHLSPEEMPGADAYLPDLTHFDPAAWGLPSFE